MKVIPLKIKVINISNIHNAICFSIFNEKTQIMFVKNNMLHNSKFHAYIVRCRKDKIPFRKYYCIYNNFETAFNNKKWKSIAKQIKRKHKLRVFQ